MRSIMKFIPRAVIIPAAILTLCTATIENQAAPKTESAAFQEDRSFFPNPERGWYRAMSTKGASERELSRVRDLKVRLILFESNLSSFRSKPISQQVINEIDTAFFYARRAGLSVIFRAAYDFSGKENPEPGNIETIIEHIRQLQPIFSKNEDILFNIQAGFLGPWGEWHSSRFGNKIRPEIQKQVAGALLESSPESVTVSVRRPEYVRTILDGETLTAENAFSGSLASRIGFHNDALLSDDTDMGTYTDRNWPRDAELAWINNHTRYTPMIGETNQVSAYNDFETAVQLLDYMNLHSLNMDYHEDVLKKWRSERYYGMNGFDYIGMMMGYRFVLMNAVIGGDQRPGGILRLDIELVNTGFGSLQKAKKYEFVLKRGNQIFRADINEDARRWYKDEPVNRTYYFQLPSDIAAGTWDVYLGLSSAFENLRNNPLYSVRFSNLNTWDQNLGLNKIGSVSLTAIRSLMNEKELKQVFP